MTRVVGWLSDWRNGAAAAATLLAVALVWFVSDSVQGRHDAERSLQAEVARSVDSRQASTNRISALTDQVGQLTDQVVELREQLVGLGVEPAVGLPARQTTPKATTTTTVRRATTTTARPTPSSTTPPTSPPPTTAPPPSTTTTTTRPTTTTTTAPCRGILVAGSCIGG